MGLNAVLFFVGAVQCTIVPMGSLLEPLIIPAATVEAGSRHGQLRLTVGFS